MDIAGCIVGGKGAIDYGPLISTPIICRHGDYKYNFTFCYWINSIRTDYDAPRYVIFSPHPNHHQICVRKNKHRNYGAERCVTRVAWLLRDAKTRSWHLYSTYLSRTDCYLRSRAPRLPIHVRLMAEVRLPRTIWVIWERKVGRHSRHGCDAWCELWRKPDFQLAFWFVRSSFGPSK